MYWKNCKIGEQQLLLVIPKTGYLFLHPASAMGIMVLTSSVSVCVCVLPLSELNRQTYGNDFLCVSSGRISRSSPKVKVKVVGQRSRLPGLKCFRGVFGLMELDGLMGLHSDEYASSNLELVGLQRGVFLKRMCFFCVLHTMTKLNHPRIPRKPKIFKTRFIQNIWCVNPSKACVHISNSKM